MRVKLGDSVDLGMVLSCDIVGAISVDDISVWALRAIEEENDPPSYLYTMLDLKGLYVKSLWEEIGFTPSCPCLSEAERHYLREIAVRRGNRPYSYLGPAADVVLKPERKAYIDELFLHNFGIEVDSLPPLDSFKPED